MEWNPQLGIYQVETQGLVAYSLCDVCLELNLLFCQAIADWHQACLGIGQKMGFFESGNVS